MHFAPRPVALACGGNDGLLAAPQHFYVFFNIEVNNLAVIHDLTTINIDVHNRTIIGRINNAADRIVIGLHIVVFHINHREIGFASSGKPP